MSTHANRVKMTVASVAADPYTITLDAASSGFRSFATAYGANATVDVLITMGTTWEIARNCTYTHSGTTLSRGTLESSSTGSRITTFDNTAVVSVIAPASFGNAAETVLGSFGALDGENSITTTATAVIGRLNVCSGTSANYTVTLPAVSGNAGKYIGFQMAPGLTKLVTLDGDGTETIDGATMRVMHAKETALLYCDGSTWTKMAGKSVPLDVALTRTTSQGFSNSTYTPITFTSKESGTEFMWDSANGRVTIPRASKYNAVLETYITSTVSADMYAVVVFNATSPPGAAQQAGPGTAKQIIAPSSAVSLAASDYINGSVYAAVGSPAIAGNTVTSRIRVSEVPEW